MTKEFLLEIGIEEIPTGYVAGTLSQMEKGFAEKLKELKIPYSGLKTFATHRRIVLYIAELAEKQSDYEEEVTGPPKKIAVDNEGNFTKAAEAFANSQGISLSDLKIISKEKKEYVGYTKKSVGRYTKAVLSEILADFILSLNFPKSMRWGEGNIRFVRPIHWILSIFGGEVVDFSIGDIKSSNKTRGHRFMANREFAVNNFAEYRDTLYNAYVVLDTDERKKIIITEAERFAANLNAVIEKDEDLFETLAYLVEYPVPMLGSFEERFLKLPKEILINTMKKHQKYIPILKPDGTLLPYFVIVSNTKVSDPQVVINGNSKVIRARFSDAEYYFEKDKTIPLESRIESLKKVVFQDKLGSYFEKTERIVQLADFISEQIVPEIKTLVKRAALLSKADLVTGMVYEFPSLQGIIGGELCKIQNENPEIAKAVYEHYLPQSPDDPIPSNICGVILSLSDKVDSLVGFFGVGMQPKGTADPYGLRRQAIGIIRLITEADLDIDYTQLIRFAYESLKNKLKLPYEKVLSEVSEFIENRFYYQMEIKGYASDIINAVVATHPVYLSKAKKIIAVMDEESKKPYFMDLVLAFKRVANITKNWKDTQFDPQLFKDIEEKELMNAYIEADISLKDAIANSQFEKIPLILAQLKPVVDNYFEKVLVMDKDENIKNNRLSFLASLRLMFEKIIDITKIQN
ncbi:MAG: glycine--tRNA ligase subunit beta [bacterium]